MNRLEVEFFLNRGYRKDELIEHDKRELQRLRALSTSVSSPTFKEKVQTSRSNNSYNINDLIIDLEQGILDKIIEREKIIQEIKDFISKLDNNIEQEVLLLRHIEFLTWYEIEDRMHYSRRQCIRIYNSAIDNLCIQ